RFAGGGSATIQKVARKYPGMPRGDPVGSLPINPYGVQYTSLIRARLRYACETAVARFPGSRGLHVCASAAIHNSGSWHVTESARLHRQRPQPVGKRDWILPG